MNDKQQSLAEAQARGEEGMQQAVNHAEREQPAWAFLALEAVRTSINFVGEEFTFEDLRLQAETLVSVPPDRRAWGAVAREALLRGMIEPTGRYAPRASGNCTPTRVYRKGKFII